MSRIQELVDGLRAEGVEVGGLRELGLQFEAVEQPLAWKRLEVWAETQWERALGEFTDTSELLAMLARAIEGELSPEEHARMSEQLGDLVRLVPAVLVTVALKMVPGGVLVAPWMLRRTGLLPSNWREAHMLERLGEEAETVRVEHPVAAARIDVFREVLTEEAAIRAALQADLQAHWDEDRDGLWDPSERDDYQAAVSSAGEKDPWHRSWYLFSEDAVFGPVRLSELPADLPPVLVSWGGEAWLKRADLEAALER